MGNQKPDISGKLRGGSPMFYMFGNRNTAGRLTAAFHEFEKYNNCNDDFEEVVTVDDTYYLVTLHSTDKNYHVEYKAIFDNSAQVIVLIYNINSKASFQSMEMAYNQLIPKPNEGKIKFRDPNTFVASDNFPMVVIGCKYPIDGVQEVEESEVQTFLDSHPGCVFAGECEFDESSNHNVNEVIQVVVEAYHELRKKAIRENGFVERGHSQQQLVPPAIKEQKKKKRFESCILL